MVVEDDVPLRGFIAERLLDNGLDVVETGDGLKAGNSLQNINPTASCLM